MRNEASSALRQLWVSCFVPWQDEGYLYLSSGRMLFFSWLSAPIVFNASLHVSPVVPSPRAVFQERGQGLWSWLRFSGGMAEQWVHQVHCQPGLLTQPQGELAARLALLHDLAAQRLTLGPLRRASSAQQPWPTLQDGPAEESSSDRDGSGHAAGSWETLELEHDPAEGSSTAGAGLAGDRWYEVGDDGDPVEETGQESTLASDSTVFGMFSRHQTGDGWQRLGQMSDGGAPERTSDAHAHAAVASSEDGAPWRAPCYESSEDSVRLRASLALEGVPALSNAGAALVRRVVQRTPALLSSSVPVDDMQAKVGHIFTVSVRAMGLAAVSSW